MSFQPGSRRTRSRSPSKEDALPSSKRPKIDDNTSGGFVYPKRAIFPVEESVERPRGDFGGRARSHSREGERTSGPPPSAVRAMRARSHSPEKARIEREPAKGKGKGKGKVDNDDGDENGRERPEIFVDWGFKGVPAATPFAGPYKPFSLAILPKAKPFPKHPGTDPLITYSHLNCSYLSPHYAGSNSAPSLFQLKSHCLSISNLIFGIQEFDGSAAEHPPMDWVKFVGTGRPYKNDAENHHWGLTYVVNNLMDPWPAKQAEERVVSCGGSSSEFRSSTANKDARWATFASAKEEGSFASADGGASWNGPESISTSAGNSGGSNAPETSSLSAKKGTTWTGQESKFPSAYMSGSAPRPQSCPLASGSASHSSDSRTMLGHANDILEALDYRFAHYGGLLSLLAPPGHPQRQLIEDTYVGQWMIYTANLSMRVAQLEVEVENSRNVLAGEATAPWVLGRSSFFGGGEGGEFGRALLFPQDRYVLSGLSQGLWERMDERLLRETERKNAVEGTMAAKLRGGRDKPGSGTRGDLQTLPGQPLEPIVWIDIKSRVYRVQGEDTMFVVLGHGGDLSPETEFTAQLEKMPLVSVLPYQVPGQDEARIRQEMAKEIRIKELLEEQQRLKREVLQGGSEIAELKGTKGKGLGADKRDIFLLQLQVKRMEAQVHLRDSKLATAAEERVALEQALKDKTASKDNPKLIDALNENVQLRRELAAAHSDNQRLKNRLGEGEKAGEGASQNGPKKGEDGIEDAEVVVAVKPKPRVTRSGRGRGKKAK